MCKRIVQKAMGTVVSGVAFIILLFVPTGCRVGPNYHAPIVPVPPAFEGRSQIAAGLASASPANGKWWTVFSDSELDALEAEADTANRDIRIAIAHVDQANAVVGAARGSLFPTIGASPSISRNREAQDRPISATTSGSPYTYNDLQIPLVMDYEIDAWGRVRRSLEAVRADQQASQADLRFVRLTAETNVAVAYFHIRENDQELQVLDETLKYLAQALDLTRSRFDRGLSSDLEVAQAQTILDQTNASKQTILINRYQSEHAIAVLLGKAAETFRISVRPALPPTPAIPIGIPADLLKRRPDISEADRNVAAATARIGIAKAAYFPQLSLTGLAGFESVNASSIFTWQNSIASLGASVAAPIFTGGRLRAGVNQANAVYRTSLFQYEKSVLTSYQEVEDQLTALNYLATQSKMQSLAVEAATRAELIANKRYESGLVSYLDVTTAQQAVLANIRASTQIAGQRLVATAILIKALGGSWSST
jgi:multidrug efflux system outer membrane protein